MAERAWPIDTGLLEKRLDRLRAILAETKFDAVVVTDWDNLFYLTALQPIQAKTRRFAAMPFVVSRERGTDPVFIAPALYRKTVVRENKYLKDVRDFESGGVGESFGVAKAVEAILREWGLSSRTIGLEYDSLNAASLEGIRASLPDARLEDCSGLVEGLRMIKTPHEIALLKKASKITERAVDDVVQNFIRPGVTELEIARAIIASATENGAEGVSFFPQVFSGYRGSLFNTIPSYRRIKRGDTLLLDFGVFYEGYATDITRVVSLGRLDRTKAKVYDAVRQIVEQTISAVRTGMTAEDLHRASLHEFEKAGYGGFAVHSTGHGIGLSVWERPYLRDGDTTRLKSGMTLAIEQGVYLKDYGFRLEQNLSLDGGSANVFNGPMDLIVI